MALQLHFLLTITRVLRSDNTAHFYLKTCACRLRLQNVGCTGEVFFFFFFGLNGLVLCVRVHFSSDIMVPSCYTVTKLFQIQCSPSCNMQACGVRRLGRLQCSETQGQAGFDIRRLRAEIHRGR